MLATTSICGVRTFSSREADELLPVLHRITKDISRKADRLIDQLERMDVKDVEKTRVVEEQVNQHILRWRQKLKKLGLRPRGLWFADFPAEGGYYSWQYPEFRLEYRQGDETVKSSVESSRPTYEPSSGGNHLRDLY